MLLAEPDSPTFLNFRCKEVAPVGYRKSCFSEHKICNIGISEMGQDTAKLLLAALYELI